MQQRKQYELLGIILHTNFPTKKKTTQIDEQKFSDLNPLCTLAIVTRGHVMQFDTHHSSVLTTPAHRPHRQTVSPSHTIIQSLCLYLINP